MDMELREEVHVYLPEPTTAELESHFYIKTEKNTDPFEVEFETPANTERKIEPDIIAIDEFPIPNSSLDNVTVDESGMFEMNDLDLLHKTGRRANDNTSQVDPIDSPMPEKETQSELRQEKETEGKLRQSSKLLDASVAIRSHPESTPSMIYDPIVLVKKLSSGLQKQFVCRYCENILSNKDSLTAHLQLHELEEARKRVKAIQFFCAHCDHAVTKKSNLIPHMRIHGLRMGCSGVDQCTANRVYNERCNSKKKTPLKCDKCGLTFSSYLYLKKHEKSHLKKECIPSEEVDKSVPDCKRGKEYLVDDFPVTRNVEGPFYCADCDGKFEFKADLIIHTMQHRTDISEEVCPICGKKPFYLRKHIALHIDEKCYKCDECYFRCTTVVDLRHHRLNCHKKEKRLKCDKCDLSFLSNWFLKKHRILHSRDEGIPQKFDEFISECQQGQQNSYMKKFYGSQIIGNIKDPFCCADCNEKFEFKTDLIMHTRKHRTDTFKNVCLICGKKHNHRMREHVAGHVNEKFVKCEECSYTCISSKNLRYHRLYHHKKGIPLKCDKCEATFFSYWYLNKHKAVHSSSGLTSKQVEIHSASTANGKDISFDNSAENCNASNTVLVYPSEPVHAVQNVKRWPKDEKYSCTICRASFQSQYYMDDHMKVKHRPKQDGLHKCHICCRIYIRRTHLNRHMKDSHGTDHDYFCAHCGDSFGRKEKIRKHMMKHGFQLSAECKLCKKSCSINNLSQHMTVHHQEKRYICDQCGTAFARSDYLKKHMFKHNKERPHLCSHCGAKFSRRDNLKVHEKKHILLGDQMKLKPPLWKR